MTPTGIAAVISAVRVVELVSVLAIIVSLCARWRRHREHSSVWVILSFGCLGLILAIGYLPKPHGTVVLLVYTKALLVVLLVVPYLLVRFVAALGAVGPVASITASTLVAIEIVSTLILPSLPASSASRPVWLEAYLVFLLLGWTVQSIIAATDLFRAGQGQPTVVRRRMRLLGAGTMVLAVALIAGLLHPTTKATMSALVTPVLGLVGIGLFFLSFVLPRSLRTLWRQAELADLRRAQMDLLSATSPQSVAEILVPQLARLLGGDGAAILDGAGSPLCVEDLTASELAAVSAVPRPSEIGSARPQAVGPHLLALGMPRGWLAVRASRFTPVFDDSEVGLLAHLAYLADISLHRIEMFDTETAARRDLETSVGELGVAKKQLEAARDEAVEASRLKSEFLANMSHEIRTPMNGVIGMTSLLINTPLQPDQRDYADTVRFSAEALLTVIDDVLDFSKIEAGKLEIEVIDLDLGAVIEESAELLASQADAKGLELTCSVDAAMPAALRGDPGRIRQVLLNLLGNAVKFTEVGEVEIAASVVHADDHRVEVELRVRDSGIGIDPASLERLFEGFTQADASTTRRFGGTGLGLSISRQLVSLMGGSLSVSSQLGEGSTFTVRLPCDRGATPIRAAEKVDLLGARVLIVDDNATNRRVLLGMLSALGAEAGCAGSAAEGEQLLSGAATAGRPYDVALIDLNMPQVDGLTLAATVRANPVLAGTRLLLLTSSSQRSLSGQRRHAEIDGYLAKPIRVGQLQALLLSVLGRADPVPGAGRPEVLEQLNLRLLMAEDNLVNQKVAKHTLHRLGCQVEIVANGEDALTALSSRDFDAVLMDCQMPILDGYSATRELRRREGPGRHTPVIALTASAMTADRDRCIDAGMDDYLSKPVRSDELAASLRRLVPMRGDAGAPDGPPQETGAVMGPAIDTSVLDELTEVAGADPECLKDLVVTYLAEAGADLDRLMDAAGAGDRPTVRTLAHRMRASSGALGAAALVVLLLGLEASVGDLTAGAAGAQAEFRRVETELRRVIESVDVLGRVGIS